MIDRKGIFMKALRLASGWALAAIALAAPSTYTIDSSHSSVQFSVRHLMISNVRGEFSKMTGTVVYDPANLSASSVEAVIDANTISTREAKRDAHLKGSDFFDTAEYPTITFKSTQFRRVNGAVQIAGDLTMHGVTKPVVLDVEGPSAEIKDAWGNMRLGATATTKINRKEWGITWNKTLDSGGVTVGDEVTITIDIEAVKKAEGGPQQTSRR
jgi:polyisoprenoid-binding protein YceI